MNWNEYHSETEPLNAPNPYLYFLINPSFQGVSRLFSLPFNANDNRNGHSRYYLLTAKVEDYNVMIDGRNFFDQPINNDIKTWKHSKNYNWSRRWLCNWLFARLQLFYKIW